MSAPYQIRPIDDWPGKLTAYRKLIDANGGTFQEAAKRLHPDNRAGR